MRPFAVVVLTLTMGLIGINPSVASDRAVNGLLIGAGSGAILGHVAGRNTESVVIGTAVGGVIGYAIGRNQDRPDKVIVHDRHRQVVRHGYHPSWRYEPPRQVYRDYRGYRHFPRDWRSDCQETVTYKKKHGTFTRIVKTSCDRPHRYYHHKPRFHRHHDDD